MHATSRPSDRCRARHPCILTCADQAARRYWLGSGRPCIPQVPALAVQAVTVTVIHVRRRNQAWEQIDRRPRAGDELMRCDRAIERRCLSIRRAPRGHWAPAVFGDSGEVPVINQQEQVGSVCNRDLAHHYSLRQSARRLPVQILPKVKQYGSFCSIVDSNQLARISRTIPAERR